MSFQKLANKKHLIIALGLLIMLPFSVYLVLQTTIFEQRAHSEEAIVEISPNSGQFGLEEEFQSIVKIIPEKGREVVIGTVVLNYDPRIVEVVSIQGSDLFAMNIKLEAVPEQEKIFINQGAAGSQPAVGGEIDFAVITFRSLSGGEALISFDESRTIIVDAQAMSLSPEFKPARYRFGSQPIAPTDSDSGVLDPECFVDVDCASGQVCDQDSNKCITLTDSQTLLSITTSLEGVPHQAGPISHHPKEHGREISMRVTLINVNGQSNEKAANFVYDEAAGTYQTKQAIVYDDISPGPHAIVITGPKHLAARYCHYDKTDKSCELQDLAAITTKEQAQNNNFIWLEPGKASIDLSSQPILAGDLPISGMSKNEQDGEIDVFDYSFLIHCLGDKSRTSECISKADLNFSGHVSNIDLMLLRRTLHWVSNQI